MTLISQVNVRKWGSSPVVFVFVRFFLSLHVWTNRAPNNETVRGAPLLNN